MSGTLDEVFWRMNITECKHQESPKNAIFVFSPGATIS